MSAIAGIINLDGSLVEPQWIEAMLNRFSYRDTDDCNQWVKGSSGFGHIARWTTPESSLEKLPMTTPGACIITGDVRLDNREDLLSQLRGFASLSPSTPDCALVVAAYEKWEEQCVDHLLGDFAFAIWDTRKRKLFCARDHMGVKPFYYAELPGRRFVFASEIKAVLCVPGVSNSVNPLRIADAFVHLVNDHTTTYYSQVLRLPPAHCLTVKDALETRRYWRLDPDRELKMSSDHEYGEVYHGLFSQAVRSRLRSSHPVGSMLSGGLDSSSVSCVARDWLKAEGREKLRTFSAVFDEVRECDERPYIQAVLDQGHCDPSFIILDRMSPMSEAEAMMARLDEPISAGNLYLSWNAFRKAEELGVRVVLDGFDGDTTVSHGGGRMTELALAGRWRDLAIEVRGGAKNFHGDYWLRSWSQWLLKYHPAGRRVNRVWSGLRRRLAKPRPGNPKSHPIDVLNPDLTAKLGLREIFQKPAPPFKGERHRHFQMLEREIMTKCTELLAHTSATFGVEVRFPFMDIRLIEFCLSLPSDQKMRGGFTRVILRRGMTGVLPEKIRQRGGKSNLGPSFDKGLFKYERDNMARIIREEAGALEPYVDLKQVGKRLELFGNGTASSEDATVIWTTVGLALWLLNRPAKPNPFIQKRKEVNNK